VQYVDVPTGILILISASSSFSPVTVICLTVHVSGSYT